jgi:DNA-binding SARP family transcriptional activator
MWTAATSVVRCFGDFSLCVNGKNIDHWHAGKARSLFQYLLVNRGRLVGRETLYKVLWPDAKWSPTASSLKVAMHSVRRTLEQAADLSTGQPIEIVSRDHGYLLQTNGLRVDLDEFDTCMNAQNAGWIDEQRQCYRALALYALTNLRAEALRRDDHAAIITLCRRILEIEPYHEEMYQTLMLMHGRRGELGQVGDWHRLCVQRLGDDLGLRPTSTTQRIFFRAMRGELRPAPALDLAPVA